MWTEIYSVKQYQRLIEPKLNKPTPQQAECRLTGENDAPLSRCGVVGQHAGMRYGASPDYFGFSGHMMIDVSGLLKQTDDHTEYIRYFMRDITIVSLPNKQYKRFEASRY